MPSAADCRRPTLSMDALRLTSGCVPTGAPAVGVVGMGGKYDGGGSGEYECCECECCVSWWRVSGEVGLVIEL